MADRAKPLSDGDISKIISHALDRGAVLPEQSFPPTDARTQFRHQDTVATLEERRRIKAVWNDIAHTWNYDVRGHDLDGNELTIRIVPTDDDTGIVSMTGF